MQAARLSISEVFYSIQGEGPWAGRPSLFIRLGGCNLLCESANWRCDTIEVWRKSRSILISELVDNWADYLQRPTTHVVLTGGEPLMQQKYLTVLVKYLTEKFPHIQDYLGKIQIETNGTILPNEVLSAWCYFNVSPKLASSGVLEAQRYKPDILRCFAGTRNVEQRTVASILKFVVSASSWEQDIQEIESKFLPLFKTYDHIWLMPAGDDQVTLNNARERVVELCKEKGFCFSDRLHITIWNKKTGV